MRKHCKIIAPAVMLGVALILLVGCQQEFAAPPGHEYIDMLADTIYSGDKNLIAFLSDGNGGYYYSDVLLAESRSELGYFTNNQRILAAYDLLDGAGIKLNDVVSECIVHPEWIERHYDSGLVERIEMPVKQNGIMLTFRTGAHSPLLFRPWFEGYTEGNFSETDSNVPLAFYDEQENHSLIWVKKLRTWVGEIHKGIWIGISCSGKIEFNYGLKEIKSEYPSSGMVGKRSEGKHHSPGDFIVKSGGKFSFVLASENGHPIADTSLGFSLDAYDKYHWHCDILPSYLDSTSIGLSLNAANRLLNEFPQWQYNRQLWSLKQVEPIEFVCDNKPIEHAYAWSRLTLAKMLVHDRAGNPVSLLNTNKAFTNLSLPGIAAMYQIADASYSLMNSHSYPPHLTELGTAVLAFNYISSTFGTRLTSVEDSLVIAAADYIDSVCSDVNFCLENALLYNDGTIDIFADQPTTAKRRTGARIEDQIFFGIVRNFLRNSQRYDSVGVLLPDVLINGLVSEWYNFGKPSTPPVVSGKYGQYRVPMTTEAALLKFQDHRSGRWWDHIEFQYTHLEAVDRAQRGLPTPVITDTTQTAAHIMALGWYRPESEAHSIQGLTNAYNVGLAGEFGFRSMASTEPLYTSAHEYLTGDEPEGTVLNGDILLWTAGRMADMWYNIGQYDSLAILIERLSRRILNDGVIGSLAEAENGESLPFESNISRNPLCALSTAEFVRVLTDDILGISQERQSITLRPAIPKEWGYVRLTLKQDSSSITIERNDFLHWTISQSGFDPDLYVALQDHPEVDIRVVGSVRVKPEEPEEIIFEQGGDGFWRPRTRK